MPLGVQVHQEGPLSICGQKSGEVDRGNGFAHPSLLITDTDSVVSGIVQRTRDEGAVTGNKEKSLIMKYLELDSDVAKGDNVITSGFGRVFEKGISIGHVVSVEKDESGLYLYAIIEPEIDMMKLEEVLVIQ